MSIVGWRGPELDNLFFSGTLTLDTRHIMKRPSPLTFQGKTMFPLLNLKGFFSALIGRPYDGRSYDTSRATLFFSTVFQFCYNYSYA